MDGNVIDRMIEIAAAIAIVVAIICTVLVGVIATIILTAAITSLAGIEVAGAAIMGLALVMIWVLS